MMNLMSLSTEEAMVKIVTERDAALAAQKRAEEERDQLLSVFAKLREWECTYGKALCPPGPDTYGEGIHAAHSQVATILYAASDELNSVRAEAVMGFAEWCWRHSKTATVWGEYKRDLDEYLAQAGKEHGND